jgi:hypothetical protein
MKDSEKEESPEKECESMIVRMTTKMKGDMYKKLQEFKEDAKKKKNLPERTQRIYNQIAE